MKDSLNKKTIGGVIVAGLLIIGGPTAIDLAVVDTVSVQPVADESALFADHIREFGNYTVEAKDFADRDSAVSYCAEGNCIRFTPASISWNTGDEIKSGPALLSNREVVEKAMKYESVYGSGIDLDITIDRDRFSKVVTIDSLETLGEIPEKAETLDMYFAIETNLFLSDGPIDSGYQLSKYSKILTPQVWGSNGEKGEEEGNLQQIHSEIKTIGETQFLVKHIPVSFLQKATFPVHTDADISYGATYAFQTEQIGSPFTTRSAAIDTDQFAVCWYRSSLNYIIDCRVGTVSATGTISYGATSTINANDSFINTGEEPAIAVCKVDTDKFATVFADDTLADDGYVVVSTVSGSTISPGTAFEFLTTDMEAPSCAQMSANKIAIAYNNETGDQLESKVCTISGTTPTCGSANVMDTDTVDATWMSAMGTDKFVVSYTSATALEINAVVATVSGTTVTDGTPYNIKTRPADNGADQVMITSMGTERFAGMYNVTDGSGFFEWTFFAGTTTGTTINRVATSTNITQPTNGPDFGQVVQIGSTTLVSLTRDFEGGAAANRDYTRIASVEWNSLGITTRSRDIQTRRGGDFASTDLTLLSNGYLVECGVDGLASPVAGGYCNSGTILPQIDTYDATLIASTTVRLNGDVLQDFQQTYSAGFVYGIDSVFNATATPVINGTATSTLTANLSGLTTFEEYGFKAFATTSLASVYDTDTFRFFTADISTSTPVTSAENHTWDNSSFTAGTHSTTTESGGVLKLVGSPSEESFTLAGTAQSDIGACYTLGICFTGESNPNSNVRIGFRSGGSFGPIVAGFRFPSFNIAQGRNINTAVFSYVAFDTDATTDPVRVYAEDTDNSNTFSTTSTNRPLTVDYGGSRSTTTAVVDWTLPDQTIDLTYSSPDLSTVIEEVLDRVGWVSGNALSLLIGDGGATDNHNGKNNLGSATLQITAEGTYTSSGYWIAPSWDVGSIGNVDDSFIEFASTSPGDSSVVVKTAINTSATVPPALSAFATSTSGGDIAGITAGADLTGKYLWVQVILNPCSDQTCTPSLNEITYAINESGGAPAQRRIILPQ